MFVKERLSNIINEDKFNEVQAILIVGKKY